MTTAATNSLRLRRQNLVSASIVGLGAAISVLLFAGARLEEANKSESDFRRQSEERVALARHELEERLEDLKVLALLCGSKTGPDREEFQRLSAQLRTGHSCVQAFEWVPRVPRSRREELEQAARHSATNDPVAGKVFSQFQITQLGPNGSLLRAAEREEYFPVYYVEPCAGNEAVVGFDAMSEGQRRQKLIRALTTRTMTATSGIRLVQESGQQRGLLVHLPVYEPRSAALGRPGSASVTNQVRGFVAGVFRIGDFVESCLSRSQPVGLDMLVVDPSVSGPEAYLHTHWARLRKGPAPKSPPPLAAWRQGLWYEAKLPVADREWLLLLKPTSALLAAQKSWVPEGLLAGGLFLTALLGGHLAVSARRAAQLAGANESLKLEIAERQRAERALGRSQFALDNASEAIFWVDKNATFTYVNKAAAELLGYTREELLKRTVHEVDPARTPQAWPAHWQEHKQEKSATREGVFRTQDGRSVAVELTINHFEYDGQEYHCTFVRDITQRKQAEAALRAAEQRWRILFEYAPDAYSLTNAQGEFIDVNKAAEQAGGYPREELLGRSFLQLNLLPAEQLAQAAAALARREEGQATGPLEFALRRKDGRVIPVEVRSFWLRIGGELFSLTSTRDITERKEAETFSKAINALLQLLPRKTTRQEYLDAVVELLGQCTGCRSVGIRMLDAQGNLPYEAHAGFSQEFWMAENRLSISQDHCVCTRLVGGQPLPGELGSVTSNGSFYSPRLKDFARGLSAEDQLHYRWACLQHGFESVALVPIRHGAQTLGAIHLADEVPGKLSPRIVELVETMAPLIGEALHKLSVGEEVRWHGETQAVVAALLHLGGGAGRLEEILKQAFDLLLVFPWRSFEPFGVLYLADPAGQELVLQGHSGVAGPQTAEPPSRVRLNVDYCRQTLTMHPAQSCWMPNCLLSGLRSERGGKMVCAPLVSSGRVLGVLGLAERPGEATRERDHRFFRTVADVLAGMIQRRRAEEALVNSEAQVRASLAEKEMLLKEVHHRVKNNLQVISSLLELQAAAVQDSKALSAFQESRLRVKTMALVHEKLYQSADLARVDFEAYARSLTSLLFGSYGGSARGIRLNLVVEKAALGLVQAIPCGLIINELVSNALKHAFPAGEQPGSSRRESAPIIAGEAPSRPTPAATGETAVKQLEVGLRREQQNWILWVRDNGVGLPANLDVVARPASLGLTIVSLLARQLGGRVEVRSQGGTTFSIKFTAA